MKKPCPEVITEYMENNCTCDEYDWPEEINPYDLDVNGFENWESLCPYHLRLSSDSI